MPWGIRSNRVASVVAGVGVKAVGGGFRVLGAAGKRLRAWGLGFRV